MVVSILHLRARTGPRRRIVWMVGAAAASLVVAGVLLVSLDGSPARGSGRIRGVAASCAALTAAQQFGSAVVVVDGTMLPGRTVLVGSRRVLASPARMHVSRYLKGRGPRVVRVDTAVTPVRNGVAVSEDGIEPLSGQQWRIYSGSSHQPLVTSICGGSRRLQTSRRTDRDA